MSNSLAKKIFASALAASTVLLSLPTVVSAHGIDTVVNKSGTYGFITTEAGSTVFRPFTSYGAFQSYGFMSPANVVTADAQDLAYPTGSFIPPQDGKIFCATETKGSDVKGECSLVTGGQKAAFTSASVFTGLGFSFSRALYGDSSFLAKTTNIDNTASAHRPGVLVNNGGTVQMVVNGGLWGIASLSDFNSYGFSFSDVVPANGADKTMTQIGVITARQPGQLSPGVSSAPVSGAVTASLASDNPAVATLVAGQTRADLAHFAFSGSGTVTTLKLKRTGVSSDSVLSSVYLYDGANRITDSSTVSSGVITFNDPAGLFTVSGNKNISVQANILTGTSGQTVGVSVDSIGLLGGTFGSGQPAGNIHSIATVSDPATVDFNTTTSPSTATINAQTDYTMWMNTITVGTRKVWMKSISLRQIGSVLPADLSNMRFYSDGTLLGTVASLDSKGYATFTFATPVALETGSRQLKMVGDIINGASRNFSFSLQQASDSFFVDSQYNVGVLPTAASSTFSARSSGVQTIGSGTLQVTKRTDSPTADVVPSASNVVLARYDLKAYGENMKIESLRVRIDEDDNDTTFTLRNGALYLDGVQIGATSAIAGDSDSTLAYTEFTFGSAAIVVPGTPRILEVRGDIYNSDTGGNDLIATDTLQVELGAGTNNVQRQTSLSFDTYPAAYVEANVLTVNGGSVTLAKNAAVGDQTFVAPASNRLLGSFNVQASSAEGSNLTNVELDDTVADAFLMSADVTALYIKLGSYTSPIKSTVTDDNNNFPVNVALAAGQTITLEVYGDVAASSTDGDGTADTVVIEPTISYTTMSSGSSTTTSTPSGQTMTSGTGAITISKDGTSPLDRVVAGNQEITAGIFKFQASNDNFTVSELDVTVPTAAAASAVTAVKLFDGGVAVGPAAGVPFTGSDADSGSNNKASFTGLNWTVTGTKLLTVKFVLNTIGTGSGTSGQNAKAQLDRVKYQDSVGNVTSYTTDTDANETYVYKSVPTVSFVDLSNTTLVNGSSVDLYKFSVTAPAQGAVSIKQFKLPVSWSDGGTADTLEVEAFKLLEDGVDITSSVTIQDDAAADIEDATGILEANTAVVVTWNSGVESSIPASGTKTYTIKGTPTGFRTTGADTVGDSVTFYAAGDSAHNGTSTYLNAGTATTTIVKLYTSAAAGNAGATGANFIWSDNSSNVHNPVMGTTSSGDWFNGYKVLNFDLSGETWTK